MPSSYNEQGDSAMSGTILSGRQYYDSKQYKKALEQFTRAMKFCPCARGVKRDKCPCKNYEKVAAEGGSIFKEAMYTCCCEIGKTFSKCDNKHHVQALDYRAATFEALGRLDRAKRDAEWILELAPRLPDGYLRLGKIARLQKDHEFAWNVYSAGIDINKDNAVDSSPKLQQLHNARKPLLRHFAKKDPLNLPTEIVMLIFSYFEFIEIPPCLGVCKLWRRTLTSPMHDRLWRNMVFPRKGMKRAPRIDVLKKLLSWAGKGGARQIVIPLPKAFGLNQQKLTLLLRASTSLEHLEIGPLAEVLEFPPNQNVWKRLRHVSLDDGGNPSKPPWFSPAIPTGRGFPLTFVNNAASSLEHLHLNGIPESWFATESLPVLLNLKSLRMSNTMVLRRPLPVLQLSESFPRLEQLWIGPNLPYLDSSPWAEWKGRWETVWNHLKVLIFEQMSVTGPTDLAENTDFALRLMTCLNHGNTWRHIRLEIPCEVDDANSTGHIFSTSRQLISDIDLPHYPEFKTLQALQSKTYCLSPETAGHIFSDALLGGTLRSFDIVFPAEELSDRLGDKSIAHLKGYEWLRGASSIRSLGCYNFRFRSFPRNDQDLPLPQFLASFPNLETLSIASVHYEEGEFATVVAGILKVTHLKKIYTTSVKGAVMDQLRAVAEGKGVQLIWGSQPEPWPVPLHDSLS